MWKFPLLKEKMSDQKYNFLYKSISIVVKANHLVLQNQWMYCSLGKTISPPSSISFMLVVLCVELRSYCFSPIHYGMSIVISLKTYIQLTLHRLNRFYLWICIFIFIKQCLMKKEAMNLEEIKEWFLCTKKRKGKGEMELYYVPKKKE